MPVGMADHLLARKPAQISRPMTTRLLSDMLYRVTRGVTSPCTTKPPLRRYIISISHG
jgi:hypothetical protein